MIFQSSPKKNPYDHHTIHLHTMKVYKIRPFGLTIEVLLIRLVLFFQSLNHEILSYGHEVLQVECITVVLAYT